MTKKLSSKYYNEQITTRENGNIQSHDQEQSKLNCTITQKVKTNKMLTKILLLVPIKQMQWYRCNVPIKMVYLSFLTGFFSILIKTFCSHVLEY